MSTTAPAAEKLLTAEEYLALPDNGQPTELVRGRVLPVNIPTPRHGEICLQVGFILKRFLEDHPVGRAFSNDSGVRTERGPDTLRGADVAYLSYGRAPRGPLPRGYLDVVPEVVFEVRSYTDRRSRVLAKVSEYLTAGVGVVVVLDEQTHTAHVYREEQPDQALSADDELTLPELHPEFRVPVRRFFQ